MKTRRTINNIRSFVKQANNMSNTFPKVTFSRSIDNEYIIEFGRTSAGDEYQYDNESVPMTCGEACTYLEGVIYSRKQALPHFDLPDIDNITLAREREKELLDEIQSLNKRLIMAASAVRESAVKSEQMSIDMPKLEGLMQANEGLAKDNATLREIIRKAANLAVNIGDTLDING